LSPSSFEINASKSMPSKSLIGFETGLIPVPLRVDVDLDLKAGVSFQDAHEFRTPKKIVLLFRSLSSLSLDLLVFEKSS
jgi:hypothetical protein